MEILPIGAGDAFAKTLFQTNYLVRPAEGDPFLIDCGHTASRALHRLGVDPRSVPAVLLSHLHADHIGGLEELGFNGCFRWRTKPRLHLPDGVLPLLWEHALRAGMGQQLKGPNGTFEATLGTYFDVRPLAGRAPFELGSVTVRPYPTPHVDGRPSWGFRLQDRATGGSALLTCDTRFDRPALEEAGAGVQAVFHDCQLLANGPTIHATLAELRTLPTEWQERTFLIHYADDWRDWEGRTGPLRFAREGQIYEF